MKTYRIDRQKSKIIWTGKTEDSTHKGYMDFEDGKLFAELGKVVEGVVSVDIESIRLPHDSGLSKEDSENLVNHLKSEAFFDTRQYPAASYRIKEIEEKNDEAEIKGIINIKDKAFGMNIPAEIIIDDEFLEARSQFRIKSINPEIKEAITKNYENGKISAIDLNIQIIAHAS